MMYMQHFLDVGHSILYPMDIYLINSIDKQQEILDEAEKYGIRLVGPNCNGIYSSSTS